MAANDRGSTSTLQVYTSAVLGHLRPMAGKAVLQKSLFQFFVELRANNDRAWFAENKHRYEREVREPLVAFITAFGPKLARISEHFVADPRPSGGSMFRIHRDVRFSKDKAPYKTNAALQFRHSSGKDVHAPGFYLHLAPDHVFMGAGLWRPDGPSLAAIRTKIVDAPDQWKKAVGGKAFQDNFEMHGESLKRPPRGFDPDHPLIEDLKRKDFIAVRNFTEKDALQPEFLTKFAQSCRAGGPMVRFLTEAVGLAY